MAHLGFPLLLLSESCFWCLLVPYSYRRPVTNHCLPFLFSLKLLISHWEAKQEESYQWSWVWIIGLLLLLLLSPHPSPGTESIQGLGSAFGDTVPICGTRGMPSIGFPSETFYKTEHFGSRLKMKWIAGEIFSLYLFILCGQAYFHLNFHLSLGDLRERERKSTSCLPFGFLFFF